MTDHQLERVVARLWSDRHEAIVAESASALAEIEIGPALESDRAYWVEYCPGYCPPLLATSWTTPRVRLLGTNAARTSAVAVVAYTTTWATEEVSPAAALVRIDGGADFPGWRLSLVVDWIPDERLPMLPRGEILPLAPDGEKLVEDYLVLAGRLRGGSPYPSSDPQFADGPYTSDLPEMIATHMETPPDQMNTTEPVVNDTAEAVAFTLRSGPSALHCSVAEAANTTSGRHGQPLTPEEALGDYGIMLEPGRYSDFTVHSITNVCVVASEGEKPAIPVYREDRTTVTGTKVQTT